MRDIKIGGETVRVTASPVTLYIYKKEFGSDLVGDLMKMQELEHDLSKMDGMVIIQMAWAMARTAVLPKSFPDFVSWLSGFEHLDFSDEEMIQGITDEAFAGFFRGAGEEPAGQ